MAGKDNRSSKYMMQLQSAEPYIIIRLIMISRFIELEDLSCKITSFYLILSHFSSLYVYAVFIKVT